jgi:hypothetical protein
MLSESSRMSSAAEARFRIQAPNSTPRSIAVIAVDTTSDRVVRRLADGAWGHATFLTAAHVDGPSPAPPAGGSLMDLTGQTADLVDQVDRADLVVMVASPGGHANAASLIGEACSQKRVMTTALVVSAAGASDEDVAKTLAQLRPWSLMVVIANDDDYIEDMLTALRAS